LGGGAKNLAKGALAYAAKEDKVEERDFAIKVNGLRGAMSDDSAKEKEKKDSPGAGSRGHPWREEWRTERREVM
jgi:hypothetical protein